MAPRDIDEVGERQVLAALTRNDAGADPFAEPLVRRCDDGKLADPGVAEQPVLDLRRGDVLAAADDELLAAPGDLEEPGLVDPRHVAGAEPAAG